MGVRRNVDRHVIDRRGEVGAVIEVDPPQVYWLALPSPLCWLMSKPGTPSSNSPVRRIGRSSSCWGVMVPSVDESAVPTRLSAASVTSTGSSV